MKEIIFALLVINEQIILQFSAVNGFHTVSPADGVFSVGARGNSHSGF